MDTFTVASLARQAGVNVETVRYYERRGLLPAPTRSDAGYRRYAAEDVWRLRFIRRAKELGFTLGEVAELLGGGPARAAADVVAAARHKLDELDAATRRIDEQRRALHQLLAVCASDDHGCLALAVPLPDLPQLTEPRSRP